MHARFCGFSQLYTSLALLDLLRRAVITLAVQVPFQCKALEIWSDHARLAIYILPAHVCQFKCEFYKCLSAQKILEVHMN